MPDPRSSPLAALAHLLVARRAVVLWLAVLSIGLLLLPLGNLRFGYSISGFFQSEDPELQAAVAHYDEFEIPDNLLLFAWDDPEPLSAGAQERLRRVRERLQALERVQRVLTLESVAGWNGAPSTPAERAQSRTWRHLLVGRDGASVGGIVVLRRNAGDGGELASVFTTLRQATADEGVEVAMAGVPYHRTEVTALVHDDLVTFLPLGTAVSALFLFWMIPHWVLALQALLVVPLTLLATLGTMVLCGVEVTMLTSTLPTLLMCMAVADGVHLVGRFVEERRAGLSPELAARRSLQRMFFPCLMTSLTTAIGFLSLCVADVADLRDMGMFAAIGVGYAFLFTVLVMPPAMSLVKSPPRGHRLDPGQIVVHWARRAVRIRPAGILVPALALLAIAVPLALSVERDHRMTADLWPESSLVVQMRYYEERFVNMMPGEILARSESGFGDGEATAQLEQLVQGVETHPSVNRTLSICDLLADGVPLAALRAAAALGALPGGLLSRDGKTARVLVFEADMGTAAYRRYLQEVRGLAAVAPALDVRPVGLQVIGTAQVDNLLTDLSRSFVGSLVVIFLLVWLQFRSVRLGLVAMVPNLFPLLTNLAIMSVAGVALRPLTIITFCVAFGLAVDDTVHLLARYREERRAGSARDSALRRTLATAGRPVVITTVLLLVGFGTILTSRFKATFSFGLLVSLALLGSLVGALVLLPQLLRLTAGKRH